jgi:hypothetical protein
MRKVSLILGLLLNLVVVTCIAAEELQDPLEWNIENIHRTHKAYKEGGATKEDLRATIEQANIILEEQEAQESTWAYVQEYHPTVPYISCFVAGAALMWLYKI